MATINDTSQASAKRVNQAVRNLGLDQSVIRTGVNGFEVPDEVKDEYDSLMDDGGEDRSMQSPRDGMEDERPMSNQGQTQSL